MANKRFELFCELQNANETIDKLKLENEKLKLETMFLLRELISERLHAIQQKDELHIAKLKAIHRT